YVVTNNHVIDRAREITVELSAGKKLAAELLAADPDADLAVLKIKSDKPLPYQEPGDSRDLMIGEPVIAVGNPLGYSHSVSTGIAIGVNRLRDLIPSLINPAQANKVDVPVKLKEERRLSPPAKVECIVRVADGAHPSAVASINGHKPTNIIDAYVQLLKAKPNEKVTLEFAGGKDAPL